MAAVTLTGTSTGQIDLITKFEAFINGTKGWSENDFSVEGLGRRLHIQKTVGAGIIYMNIRAMVAEELPNQGGTTSDPLLRGFCGYLSSGYSGVADSFSQSDAPPLFSGVAQGAFINVSDASAVYRFVVDDDFFSITVVDELGYYQHMVVSSVDGCVTYLANNSYREIFNSGNEFFYGRKYLISRSTSAGGGYEYYGSVLKDGSTLYPTVETGYVGTTSLRGVYSDVNGSRGLVGPNLLSNSPSPSIGVPVLFPFALFTGVPSIGYKQWDGVDGVKFLNKKYINDGDTVTVGGIDYVVYTANFDLPDYGIAFKVS